MEPILDIARKLGLDAKDLISYGHDKAKIPLEVLERFPKKGKLILVSAITPTPAGEGKTTTAIGLAQGIAHLGESVCVALREPSMGPCMGIKGGATGGGKSKIHPSDSINLHFTGDFHAVTSANNLLASQIDNLIYHRNQFGIDPRQVLFKRVIDMNDRTLRAIVIGLGGLGQGTPRETGFNITAASEIMAILCLAKNYEDLRGMLDRILVAFTYEGYGILAKELKTTGALMALLKDAFLPNLVQTTEGVPALVHGGPFANIAHGCNSVVATRAALGLADWAVTEAGFGFDLGAEKFFDIKCRSAELDVSAVVLVATCRALKMHGGVGKNNLSNQNADAVRKGLVNLDKHIESIKKFRKPPIVCLNYFDGDQEDEIRVIRKHCEENLKIPFGVCRGFSEGGKGVAELARTVIETSKESSQNFYPLYSLEDSVCDKIGQVARNIYGARDVKYEKKAESDLSTIEKMKFNNLPICIAKTQASLSDNPSLLGRPKDFSITVREILIASGAGFLIPITGEILRMPGLPINSQAEHIDFKEGKISGLR